MAFDISENFNVKKAWTFDSRSMRQSYAALLEFTPNDFIPEGFPVSVFDYDPELRGIYICTNADPVEWEKISGTGGSTFRFENWVAGPWAAGSIAINGEYIARAKVDIADSQTAPVSNNAFWQILVAPHALATLATDGHMSKEDKASLGSNNTRNFNALSFATGTDNRSTGANSIAGGQNSEARSANSQASGYYCRAWAPAAHSFGYLAKADGDYAFASGLNTNATGVASNAEGWLNTASGNLGAHAEGDTTTASGNGSHSQNYQTKATGGYSHSGGIRAVASGNGSFNHSTNTAANGTGAAGANSAVLGGVDGAAVADNSVTLGGNGLVNTVPDSVLVPKLIVYSGSIVDSSGNSLLPNPLVVAVNSVAEMNAIPVDKRTIGMIVRVVGGPLYNQGRYELSPNGNFESVANFGLNNEVWGYANFVAGSENKATNNYASALGDSNTASGNSSLATGLSTTASGYCAVSQNTTTTASGTSSTSTGSSTEASGVASWSGGAGTGGTILKAAGDYSFIHSQSTIAGKGVFGNNSFILGGKNNKLEATATGSGILGGEDITGSAPNTIYVPNLVVHGTITDENGNPIVGSGGGSAPTTNAGDLTSGTLNDARLSSNVALKDEFPEFENGFGVQQDLSFSATANAIYVARNAVNVFTVNGNGKVNASGGLQENGVDLSAKYAPIGSSGGGDGPVQVRYNFPSVTLYTNAIEAFTSVVTVTAALHSSNLIVDWLGQKHLQPG